ncbi:MAG: archaeosortase/exosortase family protein, partial [Spirochaetaceae bacterium]|nr:archaeosortase/exosortase family protein [Spirochaetaceae bacterium]
PPPASKAPQPERFRGVPPKFLLALAALSVGFAIPLYRWAQFALQSELFSYILLVPVVSIYLFVTGGRREDPVSGARHPLLGVAFGVAGLAVLGGYGLALFNGTKLVPQDSVALTTFAFVLLVVAVSALLLPGPLLRKALFPLIFLVFMTPFPVAVEHGLEMLLQHGSAPPSYWFFKLAGTPVFRQDLILQLPGITLQVAPECSGIRSTIVLFLTSLVASHLYLNSGWKRAILIGAVLPLALVRNGFRIFVIGELCVRIGPHMIDSIVHKRGGPIFFALSLIPFSILVYFLVKSDRKKAVAATPITPS